jgi:hypothetical protein
VRREIEMIFRNLSMLSKKQMITLGMSALVLACSIAYTATSAETEKAANGLVSGTMDYMDPFSLKIIRYTYTPVAAAAAVGNIPSPVTVPSNIGNIVAPPTSEMISVPYFLRPLVRVPYKPEFRSPCKP